MLVRKVNCFAAAAKPLILLFACYINSIHHLRKLHRNISIFFSRIFIYFSSLSHILSHTKTTGINYDVRSSCTSLDIMATKTPLIVLMMDAAKLELAPKQKKNTEVLSEKLQHLWK